MGKARQGSVLLLAAVLTAGCASWRRQPEPAPLPALPPVVVEARVPETLAHASSAETRKRLAQAEAALFMGLDPGADVLLFELLRTASERESELRARALVLRARLAIRDGGDGGSERAVGYLRAALQEAPGGAAAQTAAFSLEILASLDEARQALASMTAAMAAGRSRESRQQAEAVALREQVESLQRQLDELKEVHLRIESEKDAPS